MTNSKRNKITSIATIAVAAVLAVGATTALAATGKKADSVAAAKVTHPGPKLERKDRWERKAVSFDCMWRERR